MSYTINNADRLSSLPEDVHSHILSLMPTKYAVRTSILSKSWRFKWMFVTNLDFDDSHPFHDLDCFSKFVDRVLELQKSPQVKSFRMCFSEMWVKKSNVSKWIDAAVKLNVSELDVNTMLLELPLSLFTCKTLTKLRLEHNTQYFEVWECSSPVHLPCLKTLDIFIMTNPFVNVLRLIPGCPVLESLSLKTTYDNAEEDYIINIPTLKRLNLAWLKGRWSKNEVVLRVPNLEYLYAAGVSSFVMDDMPSLVEASVLFHHQVVDHLQVEFLKGISGVKSLSIQHIPSTSPLPIFPNLRHLELKSCQHSGLIPQFLEYSPELKHLCIKAGFFLEPEEYRLIEPKLVPACMLTNLTTIEFLGCKGMKHDMEFMKYMLGNAQVLKTVAITWRYLCIKEQMRLRAKLLKFPRASRCCEIHFLGN